MIIGKHDRHYKAIVGFYDTKKTLRNNVPLINHIDEGLHILGSLSASTITQQAFCIHPILQSDENLNKALQESARKVIGTFGVLPAILAMEYRNQLNKFSLRDYVGVGVKQEDRRTAKISELKNIMTRNPLLKHMATADKVQNRKDFEKYHKGIHPRSKELEDYFQYWLYFILDVPEKDYEYLISTL